MKLSPASSKMIMVICIAALVFVAGGAVAFVVFDTLASLESLPFALKSLPFALGVLLTSGLNIFKVVLLEKTVRKTVEMDDPNTGKNYVRFQYLIRYFLTAAILLVAGLTPFISVWGALCGIFTMQISIIAVRSMKFDDKS